MSRTSTQLAEQINAVHRELLGVGKGLADAARRAGELLLKAKEQAGHGNWLAWLAANCPALTSRTAQNYIAIAQGWPRIEEAANAKHVSYSPSVRFALRALSEPAEDDDDDDEEEEEEEEDDDDDDDDDGDDGDDGDELTLVRFLVLPAEKREVEAIVGQLLRAGYGADRVEVLMRALRAAADYEGTVNYEHDSAA